MSLISKEHLSLTLKTIKNLLSKKADKSELQLNKIELQKELQEEISKVSENMAQADWNETDESSKAYILNKPDVALQSDLEVVTGNLETVVNGKMDTTNPVGAGSFSMNRLEGSIVGDYSSAMGHGTVAAHLSESALGQFNTYDVGGNYAISNGVDSSGLFKLNDSVAYSSTYSFDDLTGKFTLGSTTTRKYSYLPTNVYYIQGTSTSGDYVNLVTSNNYYSSTYRTIGYTRYSAIEAKSSKGEYLHVVGNGSSDDTRSNAHTLDWDGNAWFAGDVYVGSTSGTNKDDGSLKLATVKEVESCLENVTKEVETYLKNIASPRPYFMLVDDVTSYEYIVCVRNGNLISMCKTVSIAVTAMPTTTEYIKGEPFNPAGMIVTATRQDGSTSEISDYTYDNLVTVNNCSAFEIQYSECGETYTTTIALYVTDTASSLSDFVYTIEENGTYTLTGWNGTLNGVVSNECIIPDSAKINL